MQITTTGKRFIMLAFLMAVGAAGVTIYMIYATPSVDGVWTTEGGGPGVIFHDDGRLGLLYGVDGGDSRVSTWRDEGSLLIIGTGGREVTFSVQELTKTRLVLARPGGMGADVMNRVEMARADAEKTIETISRLHVAANGVTMHHAQSGWPASLAETAEDGADLVDAWGRDFYLAGDQDSWRVCSSGPDGRRESRDDFCCEG